MTVVNLYDLARDRFLAAEAAVEEAPESMADDDFAELVTARNQAARALAGTPAQSIDGIATKLFALSRITSEREAGSYGDGADVSMERSIREDLGRLASLPV